MTAQAWLDVLPTIPLARGVPVLESKRRKCIALRPSQDLSGLWLVLADPFGGLQEWRPEDLTVDLNDPQGFGYALRLLYLQRPVLLRQDAAAIWGDMEQRHWRGLTTDADRLMLAKAILEARQ